MNGDCAKIPDNVTLLYGVPLCPYKSLNIIAKPFSILSLFS